MNEAATENPSVIKVRVERREKPGLVPSLVNPAWTAGRTEPTVGLFGEIELSNGVTFQVSRLAGETDWTADAAWRGSYPIFSNGYGARYLRTQVVSLPAAVEALNAEAAKLDTFGGHVVGCEVCEGEDEL